MDGLGTQTPLNPRQQVEARIADLDRRIDKVQADYEEAHLNGAGEDELFSLAAKLSGLRTQRGQWLGGMRNHGHKHPAAKESA